MRVESLKMKSQKSRRDIAAEKIARLLIEHMEETMTPARGKAMLKDIRTFSLKPRRSSLRGKPSRAEKTADYRPRV
jgi:hypothetical protein